MHQYGVGFSLRGYEIVPISVAFATTSNGSRTFEWCSCTGVFSPLSCLNFLAMLLFCARKPTLPYSFALSHPTFSHTLHPLFSIVVLAIDRVISPCLSS